MQKKSILIAASIYPPDPGGPALHAKKQYEFFQSEGFQVELVALAHYRKFPKGIRHLFFFVALCIKALRVDVVYAHDALGVGLPATLVSKLLRKKLLIRIGGDLLWEREAETGRTKLSMGEWYEQKLYRVLMSYTLITFVLNSADRIIVPATLLKQIYSINYGVPEEKIIVVANPIPPIDSQAVDDNQKTIVYASRLVTYKNIQFVIESMANILPQFPAISFVVFGDGPERIHLENRVRELGMNNQIIFRGTVSQDEVMNTIKRSLITLAPALTEFNPNYVLQGISMQKPFLISCENGFSFSIPNQFTFHPRSHEEFEQKLTWILSDAGYQEAKSLLSTIQFSQTWEENLKKNSEIIENIAIH